MPDPSDPRKSPTPESGKEKIFDRSLATPEQARAEFLRLGFTEDDFEQVLALEMRAHLARALAITALGTEPRNINDIMTGLRLEDAGKTEDLTKLAEMLGYYDESERWRLRNQAVQSLIASDEAITPEYERYQVAVDAYLKLLEGHLPPSQNMLTYIGAKIVEATIFRDAGRWEQYREKLYRIMESYRDDLLSQRLLKEVQDVNEKIEALHARTSDKP